jgi:signal transduction histidine kinase
MKPFRPTFFFLWICCIVMGFSTLSVLHGQDPNPRTVNYYRINTPKTSNDRYLGLRFFDSILPEDLAANDTLNAVFDLRMSAIATFELGDYITSENQVIQALSYLDDLPYNTSHVEPTLGLYNQLGRIHNAQLDYEGARKDFQKALAYASRNDSIVILNNIGNTYLDIREWENAANYYRQALALTSTHENTLRKAMVLDNLGRTQSALDAPNALSLLQEGLQMRKSIGLSDGLYASYKGMAWHYQHRHDLSTALHYADTALSVARQLNSPSYIQDALSLQIDLGNFEVAEAFKHLSDSLTLAKQIADNKYAAQKYNVDQERKSTEAQKLQTEKEKKLRVIFQALAILLVLLGSFLIYFFRNRQRQKVQQQVQRTESHISKKVHDEVANEVYGVMTRLQGEKVISEELIDHLENIYNKTRDISREHNPIDPAEPFEQILQDLILTFQSLERNVITKNVSGIDWKKVSPLKKTGIYRVLQELLTNTKKHSEASIVAITFQQNGSKIQIEYADNGVGCSLKKRGGLLNTENRIQSLGGKITFESSPKQGFKSKIEI